MSFRRLQPYLLVSAMLAVTTLLASCSKSSNEKPVGGKNGEARLDSFDAIPPDVLQAVKDKKTVWAIDDFSFLGLSDRATGHKDATYLILQGGKLVSFVWKTNDGWYTEHMKDKSLKEYAIASTHPAGEFAIGTNFKCRVKGNQTEEARIEAHFTLVTNMDKNPDNIITGEATTTLILVWNKGGTKGSWDADEGGWTQVQTRGRKFNPEPIARTKRGFASRLSDDGYTFKSRTAKEEDRAPDDVPSTLIPKKGKEDGPASVPKLEGKDGPPKKPAPETDSKAWLRDVTRMDLHLMFGGDPRTNYKEVRHLLGNAAEAEKAKNNKDSFFKYDKPLGQSSAKHLPGTVSLWRKSDPKTGGHTYYTAEGDADKRDGILGWVWTEKKPGLVEVFVLESTAKARELQPANLFFMTTNPNLRDTLVEQGRSKLAFTFFVIDPDEK